VNPVSSFAATGRHPLCFLALWQQIRLNGFNEASPCPQVSKRGPPVMSTVKPQIDSTLQLPRVNGIPPKAQPPVHTPALKPAATPKDSVHFGASSASSHTEDLHDVPEVNESPKLNALQRLLHNTPVVKNLYAGIKGGLKGTFEGPWHKYFGGAALFFLVTSPLALFIPGSHFILLPAYVATRRAIRGISQAITGLTNPDKILNPQKEAEEEV
jgi:hypothetical protein